MNNSQNPEPLLYAVRDQHGNYYKKGRSKTSAVMRATLYKKLGSARAAVTSVHRRQPNNPPPEIVVFALAEIAVLREPNRVARGTLNRRIREKKYQLRLHKLGVTFATADAIVELQEEISDLQDQLENLGNDES